MRRQFALLAALELSMLLGTGCSQDTAVSSPDGGLTLRVAERDGRIGYTLSRGETLLLDFSTLGFELRDAPALRDELTIDATARTSFDQTWGAGLGRRALRPQPLQRACASRYANAKRPDAASTRCSACSTTASDSAAEFPEQPALGEFVIMDELTEFRFPQDHMAWWMPTREPYYESIARHTPLSRMDTVNTPLTLECADGTYLALHEADLTDYAKMSLRPAGEEGTTLRCCPHAVVERREGLCPDAVPHAVAHGRRRRHPRRPGHLAPDAQPERTLEDRGHVVDPAGQVHRHLVVDAPLPGDLGTGARTRRHDRKHDALHRLRRRERHPGCAGRGWNVGWDGAWTKNTDRISFTQPYPDFDIARIAEYAASKGVEPDRPPRDGRQHEKLRGADGGGFRLLPQIRRARRQDGLCQRAHGRQGACTTASTACGTTAG